MTGQLYVRTRARASLVGVLLVVMPLHPVASAQNSQTEDARRYESLAMKAYGEKDYAAFLENIKRAEALRPNHPRLMYYVAAAYSLNGNKSEAVAWLARVTRMGLVLPAESSIAFQAIKETEEFKAILESFRRNKLPVGSGTLAFTVREKGIVPEGIAYDPATKTFYLSSIYKRKILRIGTDGAATEFASERDGLWSVFGMKVDVRRRLLWACTAAHQQMPNLKEDENGMSALLKFDLRSGRVIKKYPLPNKPKPHLFGDLVINSRGDVFTSDSTTPAVYVVRHDRDELETFLENDAFVSPQGLAFSPDETKLFMADYSKGVFLIDLKTKKFMSIEPAPDSTLLGIDGLYFYRGSLIGVQNGVTPQRVIRLRLKQEFTRIISCETLEANNPVFDEPTLGVLVRDRFYFIANSQWSLIDQKGNLAAPEKLKEPVILKIRL